MRGVVVYLAEVDHISIFRGDQRGLIAGRDYELTELQAEIACEFVIDVHVDYRELRAVLVCGIGVVLRKERCFIVQFFLHDQARP